MKKVFLYCDGSSLGNPGPGGWCSILEYNGREKVISGGEPHTTNNRMELLSVIEALKLLKEKCEVEIISDSQYVVNGINQWLSGWINRNFKNVKNPEMWKEYINLSEGHKITATWVKGHAGHQYNERCDIISKSEASKFKN